MALPHAFSPLPALPPRLRLHLLRHPPPRAIRGRRRRIPRTLGRPRRLHPHPRPPRRFHPSLQLRKGFRRLPPPLLRHRRLLVFLRCRNMGWSNGSPSVLHRRTISQQNAIGAARPGMGHDHCQRTVPPSNRTPPNNCCALI